VTINIYTCTIE